MNENELKKTVAALRSDERRVVTVQNTEWYSLFREEIRNSIAIEGVFANRQELIDVLEHNKRTDKEKTAAILGYFEAASTIYDYAYNQWQEDEFLLRISDIKQIHTILMRYEKETGSYIGEIGSFRKTTAEVTLSQFTPTNHFYVRPAIDLMVRWINSHLKRSDYSPITIATIAHAWFETIHPFRDGNGRAGRILLNYILIGTGYLNITIKGFSKANRDKYYDALEKGDGCFEAISRLLEQGKKLSLEKTNKIVVDKPLDKLKEIVMDQLAESVKRLKQGVAKDIDQNALVPLRDLARLYDYSQDYLRNLINRGEVKAQKKGKLWYVKVKDMADYVANVDRTKK